MPPGKTPFSHFFLTMDGLCLPGIVLGEKRCKSLEGDVHPASGKGAVVPRGDSSVAVEADDLADPSVRQHPGRCVHIS
ncbi:hypothetical protein DIPPA_30587 [Diplonema papillatum]|nr:hypothetical protein DIPPA_30587 [Diplonema papillatum]